MIYENMPYTNFHDLNLDWVINQIKSWGAEWATTQQEWTDEQQAFEAFKTYVNGKLTEFYAWFDNLDVQVEINNKLDAMFADHEFDALIADKIVAPVDNWLSARIHPEQGYALDNSLTSANSAAPAGVVGARLEELRDELSEKMEFYKVELVETPAMHFEHEGVTLRYADLAEKYRDSKYFLYCEYRSVTFIPSLPPDTDPAHDSDLLEFTAVWDYEGEHRVSTIKINSNNQIRASGVDSDFFIASEREFDSVLSTVLDISVIRYKFKNYAYNTTPGTIDRNNPAPSSSGYNCTFIPCSVGDVFTINAVTGSPNYRPWVFITENGTKTSSIATSNDIVNDIIVAPANAAYLLLNNTNLNRISYIGNVNRVAMAETNADNAVARSSNNTDVLVDFGIVSSFWKQGGYSSSTMAWYNTDKVICTNKLEIAGANKLYISGLDRSVYRLDCIMWKSGETPYSAITITDRDVYTTHSDTTHFALRLLRQDGGTIEPSAAKGITVYTPKILNNWLFAKFRGKKLSIIGDSISTFNGSIPTGYATFYPSSATAQGGRGSLTTVEQTWWYKLCKETGMDLLSNASWSGSTVCGNTYATESAHCAASNARINALSVDGVKPDIIIIYIGINDLFNDSTTNTLGNWTPDNEIPADASVSEFSKAYAIMVNKAMTAYPDAKVFCCTLLTTARNYKDTQGVETFPTKHNGVTLNQVNNKIREIANGIGANVIEVFDCGVNYANIKKYTLDCTHPNSDGAEKIKSQILAELIAKY